jgi:hypothetical protein
VLAAPLLLLAGGCVIPDGVFFVENATNEELRCRHRVGGSAWSGYRTLAPGAEFSLTRRIGMGRVRFFCDPPVARVSYTLAAGKRLALLRTADGTVELREIAVDGGSGSLPGN